MKLYYHRDFEELPVEAWQFLLNRVLGSATHLEVCRSFSEKPLSAAFGAAEVALPENIERLYVATNRFILTPEVIAEIKAKPYLDWDTYYAEDPAFYQGNVLLLGTISHEDLVYMRLDEEKLSDLSSQGFDFRIE